MATKPSNKAKGGTPNKTPNRQGLYAIVAVHTKEAILILVELMKTAKNESVKMGAAKALLDKSLPDVKAIEVSGEDGGPLRIIIVNETGGDDE